MENNSMTMDVLDFQQDALIMTTPSTTSTEEAEELGRCFKEFVCLGCKERRLTAEERNHLGLKACTKLVRDCMPKEMLTIIDIIFPRFRERGKQTMHVNKFLEFVQECAFEYAKLKTKNPKLMKEDATVGKFFVEFKEDIKIASPNIQKVKERVAGKNIDKTTD